MHDLGMEKIDTYIGWRQNTISQYITAYPILKMHLAVEKRPGKRSPKLWW